MRAGRVERIELLGNSCSSTRRLQTSAGSLHVDCTADGLERRPPRPIFSMVSGSPLQAVRTCQQVFSAAFIAHVEASYEDDTVKNQVCQVIPHPNTDLDWVALHLREQS